MAKINYSDIYHEIRKELERPPLDKVGFRRVNKYEQAKVFIDREWALDKIYDKLREMKDEINP